MSGTIYVINPNSTARVTREIDVAVASLRIAGGPAIECLTLAEGPPGIQSQRDVDGLIPALLKRAAGLEKEAAAFVIACFSDPGMHALREQSEKPVLGIAESGVLTALTLGQRFGIVAMLQNSIPRHLRYLGAMGLMERFAGDLPVNLTIAEMADDALTLGRMITRAGRCATRIMPMFWSWAAPAWRASANRWNGSSASPLSSRPRRR